MNFVAEVANVMVASTQAMDLSRVFFFTTGSVAREKFTRFSILYGVSRLGTATFLRTLRMLRKHAHLPIIFVPAQHESKLVFLPIGVFLSHDFSIGRPNFSLP